MEENSIYFDILSLANSPDQNKNKITLKPFSIQKKFQRNNPHPRYSIQ